MIDLIEEVEERNKCTEKVEKSLFGMVKVVFSRVVDYEENEIVETTDRYICGLLYSTTSTFRRRGIYDVVKDVYGFI